MTEYRQSIVEYFSERSKSRCGYCKTKDGSITYGLHAHTLTVEAYQAMIDRGWRRSGKYCYKALMDRTCCPYYTIRCSAKDFKLSKSQKRILKRFNNFLVNGTITKDKCCRNTDLQQPIEIFHPNQETKVECVNNLDMTVSLDIPVNDTDAGTNIPVEGDMKSMEVTSKPIQQPKEEISKNRCMKAKYLRIERKRQKLQKLGLTEEEIAKKLVEKKKYPVVKTIEDYLNESLSKNQAHKLKISLVRSSPRSDEFNNTFAVSFDLYKRYQTAIHKDLPEKLTQGQFERFLVISPLQIQLVLVKSPEFDKSFKESAELFVKYQKMVHKDDCDAFTFYDFLVDSPLEASKEYGSYHQQYWLDDKLIAVGVIDILPKCVSSVYFFYDPEYSHLCLGTYAALREISFTRKLSSRFPDLIYYYMGYYIHSCVKMKYKGAFKPSYLLCPEVYTWHPIERCLPKIEASKYSRFNEEENAIDYNSHITPSDVLILYNRVIMPLDYYLKHMKCNQEEKDEIMEYAQLVGKTCSKTMVLFRS